MYGGVPVNSMKVHSYEMDTNDCDMIASDLQAGKTAVARGKKITGTGKSFEFASYGDFEMNDSVYVPSDINIIQIASLNEPIRLRISLNNMKNQNFNTQIEIGDIFVDNAYYPIYVVVDGNFLTITCEQTAILQVFYGKDNYV